MCRRAPSIEANSKVVTQIAAEAAQSYQKPSRPYSLTATNKHLEGATVATPNCQKRLSTFQQICRYHQNVGEKGHNCANLKKKQGQASSGNGPAGAGGKKEKGKGDLLIRDPRTKYKWLIDGWALLSILPPLPSQGKTSPNGTTLLAANGTAIPCYGKQEPLVTLGNMVFPLDFIIPDLTQPIISADFLAHFYLAPNHQDGSLVNLQNFVSIQADFATNLQTTRMNFME